VSSESSTDPAPVSRSGLLAAVRIDLERLHAAWMGLVFPRQRKPVHPVRGKWRPETAGERIGYAAWGTLGAPALVFAYPAALVGFAVRGYAGRLRRVAVTIGVLGVVAVAAVVWGALTAATYLGAFSTTGVVAVAAGGTVATASAALAVVSARTGGRATTLLLAYPLAVTAVFLPPIVAAFYSPALATVVFPNSQRVAIWILDNLLAFGGVAAYFRANFVLAGLGYAGMWFGLSFPVGWLLGLFVTLANLARPPDGAATS
jgi:hypothetical protein